MKIKLKNTSVLLYLLLLINVPCKGQPFSDADWSRSFGISHVTSRPFEAKYSGSVFLNYHDTLLIGGPLLEYGQQVLSAVYKIEGDRLVPFRGNGSPVFGENGVIRCIALDSAGRIVIGGSFDSVDGHAARNIAIFDGTAWKPLSGGVGPDVAAIACSQSHIYTMSAGEASVSDWDGTTWKKPSGQQGRFFTQICVFKDSLFGIASDWLVCWNGSNWSDHTTHFTNPNDRARVGGIAVLIDRLYVAGGFDSVDHHPSRWLAEFNGSTWSAFPGAESFPAIGGTLWSTTQSDGKYVYFDFDSQAASAVTFGALKVRNGLLWDGTQWSAAPPFSRLDAYVHEFHGQLYTLSAEQGIGWTNATSHGWLKDESQFGSLPYVTGLAKCDGRVFASGRFTFIDTSDPAYWKLPYQYDALMELKANRWQRMYFRDSTANDLTNDILISGMLCHDSQLYLYGGFNHFGTRRTDGLLRYDGTNWYTYHNPLFDSIKYYKPIPIAIAFDTLGTLYAVLLGPNETATFARWNVSRWDSIPQPEPVFTQNVRTFAADGLRGFYALTESYGSAIYHWTGDTWETIVPRGSALTLKYDSVYQRIDTLESYIGLMRLNDGKLFIAGEFNQINGTAAVGACYLDAKKVEPLGIGVSYDATRGFPTVECSGDWDVAFDRNTIFITGSFNMVNGETAYGAAGWDGTRWWPIGSGLRNIVRDDYLEDPKCGCGSGIVVTDSGCLVSGFFQRAGGKSSYNLGGFRIPPNFSAVSRPRAAQSGDDPLVVYPDPSKDLVTVFHDNALHSTRDCSIYDASGRDVTSLVIVRPESPTSTSFDIHALPSGQYTLHLTLASETKTAKFVVQR